MSPVSVTYFGIPGYVIFWVLFAIAFSLFIQRMYLLFRLLRLGQKEKRTGKIGQRTKGMLVEVFPQWCNLKSVTRQDLAGIGHSFMFWGFSLFLISYIIFIGLAGGFGLSPLLAGSAFEIVYSSILDIAGIFVIIVIGWAAIRRYLIKPERLEVSAEAGLILLLIIVLMLLHFCIEGFGYAGYKVQALLPPVGAALASLLTGKSISESTLIAVYRGVWWLHYAIILGFMVFIPRSKHLHILLSPINVFFRSLAPRGALKPIDLEKAETFGVSKIQDFTWKQLLDLYSCAVCGRCQDACPAYFSGKLLNPKEVIQDLKDSLLEQAPVLLKGGVANPGHGSPALIGEVIPEEMLWDCVTCRACQQVCPVYVEHVDKIIDMRRSLAMERGEFPESAKGALESLGKREHPWRGTTATRTDWADGLGVKVVAEDSNLDVLYWVGCTAALEDRNMKVAKATARVLQAAGINFGMLGAEESCCGDPARRMGDEYLFQTLCQKNIEILQGYNIKKILTTCPHCYNTLKNEYPQFGGNFEVIHHTQFIAELIRDGKLKIGGAKGKAAYHDSCYLGRYNDIYQAPREILQAIDGIEVVELSRSRAKSFCCGGGGGHMWMEEDPGKRVSMRRVEEVIEAKADVVATACPYCLSMFEDALKARGVEESIKAMDVSELVVEALGKDS